MWHSLYVAAQGLGMAQVLLGGAFAYLVHASPERVPEKLRALVPPLPTPRTGHVGKLLIQGMAWLFVVWASVVCLIPLLPAYAAFRWHDAFYRAASAIGLGRPRRRDG